MHFPARAIATPRLAPPKPSPRPIIASSKPRLGWGPTLAHEGDGLFVEELDEVLGYVGAGGFDQAGAGLGRGERGV